MYECMRRHRVYVSMGLIVFLTALLSEHAHAWEFSLKGAFNWNHEWYGQLGGNGFFGEYNHDNGSSTKAANLNFWNGS